MNITVSNDDTADLFVSLWDLNTATDAQIMDNQRLNENSSQSINIAEDGNGKGRVRWEATPADDRRISKRADQDDITAFDTVLVSAS
jgi:hypothetical protein